MRKYLKIILILALPVGIYLVFVGGNQKDLIHIEETFQTSEETFQIELAAQDDANTDLAEAGTTELFAGMETEQFAAREDLAQDSAEAEELPARKMWEQEKDALSSRMAAPREKMAVSELMVNEATGLTENNTWDSTEIKAPESKVNDVPKAAVSEEQEKDSPTAENDLELNQYVLDVIKTYQIGNGRYPYLLNNDYANYNGVTSTLSYKGKVLLKAHPSGSRASHCVGITFEVLFKAMQERNRQLGLSADDFNGMSWDNLFDLALYWFVASGSKSTNNIVLGVERYGIGKGIQRLEDARSGDFIDFNRVNGTGHTVIFMNWIKDGERIIGFRYWSSQGSTGGINYNEEYFNLPGIKGNVIMNPIYIVRILPISQYK